MSGNCCQKINILFANLERSSVHGNNNTARTLGNDLIQNELFVQNPIQSFGSGAIGSDINC
jgi:hypothetical protein